MTNLAVKKVNTLPGVLQSNTLYLVKSATTGLLEMYVTNNDASETRHAVLDSDISSIINSLDLAYFSRNASNVITDIVDKNNVSFLSNKIYPLGSQPYPWDVKIGDRILIDASCLSGYGKSVLPLEFRSDGEVWVPYKEVVLYSKFGSYASPADTVGAQNPAGEVVFPMGGARPIIPFELLYKDIGIRIKFAGFKNDADTAATLFRVRCGSDSATGSDTISQVQTSAAANHEVMFDVTIRVTTLGPAGTAKFVSPGSSKLVTSASKATNGSGDVGTLFSTTANNYVAFTSVPGNITATAALRDFQISLVP